MTWAGKKSSTGLIIGLVVCGIVIMCGMCTVIGAIASRQSGNKDTTATSNNTSTKAATTVASGAAQKTAETAETKQVKTAARIGTAVRDGTFEFVVKSIQCGAKHVSGE